MALIHRRDETQNGLEAPTRWRCGVCRFELKVGTTLDIDFPYEEEIPLDESEVVLGKWCLASRQRGCQTCEAMAIHLGMNEEYPPRPKGYHNSLLWYKHWAGGRVDVAQRHVSGRSEHLIYVIDAPPLLPVDDLTRMHPYARLLRIPSGDTRSEKAFAFAAACLTACINEHATCRTGVAGADLVPQRLIYVNDGGKMSARLIHDARALGRVPFVCLSHRWMPETGPSSLVKSRMESFANAIPDDCLYPLIKDALEITRRLGYRYIWIDCFCICQDDAADWERQAAEMADIYDNAVFTISALLGQHSGDRIFGKSEKVPQPMCTVDGVDFYTIDHTGSHPFSLREEDHGPSFQLTINSKAFPLLRRGWVSQERLLSRRTLYFAKGEIIFECQEAVKCECEMDKEVWCKFKNEFSALSLLDWPEILAQYLKAEFTFPSDKLPALSGIASRFGRPKGWVYLAGLWPQSPTFLAELQWQRDSGISPRPSARDGHHVPSWSWAAVAGSATSHEAFFGRTCELVELVSYQVKPGLNHFGIPKSVQITLRGPCIDGVLELPPPDNNSVDPATVYSSIYLSVSHLRLQITADYAFLQPGAGQIIAGVALTILVFTLSDRLLSGLVLRKIPNTSLFERIGQVDHRKDVLTLQEWTEDKEITMV